jgi:hypothetical protein
MVRSDGESQRGLLICPDPFTMPCSNAIFHKCEEEYSPFKSRENIPAFFVDQSWSIFDEFQAHVDIKSWISMSEKTGIVVILKLHPKRSGLPVTGAVRQQKRTMIRKTSSMQEPAGDQKAGQTSDNPPAREGAEPKPACEPGKPDTEEQAEGQGCELK